MAYTCLTVRQTSRTETKVGSSYPEAEKGLNGLAVRQLKWNVSWV